MISDSCKLVGSIVFSALCILSSATYAQTVDANVLGTSTTATTTQTVANTTTTSQPTSSSPISSVDTSIDPTIAPYPGCVQQLYRISGYYSPKPGQDVYTRDTYDAEIRLNGRGTHGASGAPVFNGMVAAPKSYAFGTVIVLPGLGVGQVKDRGGAIVASDGYDRIDVWVGEGDEGIHRAKSIGMRWIVGRYCPGSVTDQIGFYWDNIPHYRNFLQVAFWSIDQNIGRSGPLVTLAQDYLRSLGYLSTDILPGVYNQQMSQLVCRFQVDNLGLNGTEYYCGTLGPTTRSTLKKMLVKQGVIADSTIYTRDNTSLVSSLFTRPNVRPVWNYEVEVPNTIVQPVASTSTAPVSQAPLSQSTPLNLNLITTTFDKEVNIGDESDMVVVLQKVLMFEKLYNYKITGYFGPITKTALAQFQLKYKLIDSLNHPAAGHLGPATRALLTKKQKLLRLKSLNS